MRQVEFVNVDSAREAHDNAPQSIAQSFPNAIVEMTTPTLIAGENNISLLFPHSLSLSVEHKLCP